MGASFSKQSSPVSIASSIAGGSGIGCRFRSQLSICLRCASICGGAICSTPKPHRPAHRSRRILTFANAGRSTAHSTTYRKPGWAWPNTRFGRNAPLAQTYGEQPPRLYEPNPRAISRELLARREFVPATTVNLFLAAWLQFMVHDWLSHGANDTQNPPLRFPVPEGDDWPTREMTILRTCPDHQRGPADAGRPATYRNIVTHWWDGSQMYGSDLKTQHCVRSTPPKILLPDGKI
jgi:hypothetical protein